MAPNIARISSSSSSSSSSIIIAIVLVFVFVVARHLKPSLPFPLLPSLLLFQKQRVGMPCNQIGQRLVHRGVGIEAHALGDHRWEVNPELHPSLSFILHHCFLSFLLVPFIAPLGGSLGWGGARTMEIGPIRNQFNLFLYKCMIISSS